MTSAKVHFGLVCGVLLASVSCYGSAVAERQQALDAYMQAWTEQDLFSGTVLAAKDGDVLLEKAYGMADYSAAIANTCDTRFRIGSLTKAFTAMAVLQLEVRGTLGTKDLLSSYLPEFPQAERITLDMLLNHRSGIVDHTTLPGFQTTRRTSLCSLEGTIATFRSLPLEFSPGAKFDYSNSNYILLGHIIESVTQRSYAEVVQSRILTPLGMDRSGFEYYQRPIQNMAVGHILKKQKIVRAEDRVMENAHASGALYSTVHDLYLWERAFHSDKLVNKETLRKILAADGTPYSYGWATTRVLDKPVLAHSGETEGSKTFIMRFVDDDACLIVLSNFEHCIIDRLCEGLAAIVFDRPYQLPKKALTGPAVTSNYPAYAGRYEVKPGFVLTVVQEDEQLYCQPPGQPRLQLHPETENRFFLREVDATITFERDAEGQVRQLLLHQAGRDIPAKKL